MSYILDALKKSEKERKRGTAPDILAVQDEPTQKPKKHPLWPYLLVVALLLNAGLIFWLGTWHSEKPKIVAKSSVGERYEIPDVRLPIASPSSDKLNTTRRGTKEPIQQDQTIQAKSDQQKDTQSVQKPIADSQTSHKVSPSLHEPSRVVNPVPSEPKPGNDIPSPIEDKIYNLNELPSSIQQSLPAFTISAAVYSNDPGSRMVKINGQSMHEGEYLTAGLKLEEIKSDGVIFSFHKYRFQVGLK